VANLPAGSQIGHDVEPADFVTNQPVVDEQGDRVIGRLAYVRRVECLHVCLDPKRQRLLRHRECSDGEQEDEKGRYRNESETQESVYPHALLLNSSLRRLRFSNRAPRLRERALSRPTPSSTPERVTGARTSGARPRRHHLPLALHRSNGVRPGPCLSGVGSQPVPRNAATTRSTRRSTSRAASWNSGSRCSGGTPGWRPNTLRSPTWPRSRPSPAAGVR